MTDVTRERVVTQRSFWSRQVAWPALLPLSLLLGGFVWGEARQKAQQAEQAYAQGQYGAAAELYSDAVRAGADDAAALYGLGTAQHAAGDHARAVGTLGEALRRADEPAMKERILYNRGNALFRLNKIEEAAKAYEEALQLDPEDDDARHNLEVCRRLLEQQQPPQASPDGGGGNESGDEGDANDEDTEPESSDQQPNEEGQNQQQPDESQGQGSQGPPPPDVPELSEDEVDRMLRQLEEDERQLRPYFQQRPNSNADDPFASLFELERQFEELNGDSLEMDW